MSRPGQPAFTVQPLYRGCRRPVQRRTRAGGLGLDTELAAAYAENPTEVDRTYQGRELTVAGEWQAIRPLADAPGLLVELKAGAGRRVSCHFSDADPDHRKEFERRVQGMDVVRVRGHCVGRDGDAVVLRECTLLD